MKRIIKIAAALFSLSLLISLTTVTNAQNKKEREELLKPFPEAQEGMVRHVIEVSKKSDEANYKVEIIPGKMMSVDCNIYRLMGTLTEKNLEGWGYNYFQFTSNGDAISTLMACNQPNKIKFVNGETVIIPYNSRLPIVIYTPIGFEVKYKIWKAGKEQNSIVK